jgi:hypothetical protein
MKKLVVPDHLKKFNKSELEIRDIEFVQPFIETIAICEPKEILETGVLWGTSSILLLELSNANLTSLDPIINCNDDDNLKQGIPYPDKSEQEKYLHTIKEHYGDRWTFHKERSENAYHLIANKKYDLFHIDGDHWYGGLDADYDISLKLGIEWLLIDDFENVVLDKYLKTINRFYIPIKTWKRGNNPIALFKKIGKVNVPSFE